MANGFIGQVNIGSEEHLIGSTFYGTCDTAAGTGPKQVVLQGDALFAGTPKGITIHVKFTNSNTITNNTLTMAVKTGTNTYSTAYAIENPNGALTWNAGSVISFTLVAAGTDSYKWVMNTSQVSGSSLSGISFGNIQSTGVLQDTDVTIANGDKLVIADADSNPAGKVARASLTFDGTTTTKVLAKKGNWVDMYTHPTDAGYKHIPSGGSTGQFLKYGGSSGTASWASFSNLILKIDTGSTEDTDLYTYNGNSAKTLNIKHSGDDITFTAASNSLTIAHATGDGHKHVPATGTTNNGKFLQAGSTAGALNWVALSDTDIPNLDWSKITSGKPTTLSGYGITDALSNSTTITIAGNSVSLNGGELNKNTLITSLGLSKALRFVGTTTSNISDGWTGIPAGISDYTTPIIGDVVIKGDSEYVCVSVSGTTYTWELLGRDSSFALDDTVIHNSLITTAGDIIIGITSGSDVIPARLGVGNNTDGYVLTIDSSTHLPSWKANAATDNKVQQKGITTSGDYPILLKYDTGTTDVTANNVHFGKTSNKGLTFNPNSGVLKAYEVHGILQASDVKTALGTGASDSLIFLHKSGDWKTLNITNTTTTVASVSNGILTLVASVKENATLGMTAVT